jgi:hypothetical protein
MKKDKEIDDFVDGRSYAYDEITIRPSINGSRRI